MPRYRTAAHRPTNRKPLPIRSQSKKRNPEESVQALWASRSDQTRRMMTIDNTRSMTDLMMSNATFLENLTALCEPRYPFPESEPFDHNYDFPTEGNA